MKNLMLQFNFEGQIIQYYSQLRVTSSKERLSVLCTASMVHVVGRGERKGNVSPPSLTVEVPWALNTVFI